MVACYYGRVVGSDRDEPLDELRHHWGEAYLIEHPSPDVWVAQRRDNRKTLRADNPVDLHEEIVADFTANPISRRVAPGADDLPETPSCRFLPEG
jgi:hypothetical protein